MASLCSRAPLRLIWWLLAALLLMAAPAVAANLSVTITTSEPVTVTGTPRIAIDVGGITRYATYASGSGTASLTFSYAVQQGDFDPDGITLASPLQLNGGSITDLAGNPVANLTFTVPNTTNVKVQTYTPAFTTSPITNSNANAISFTISRAPTGADFTYSITSSGGSGSVGGNGTISGSQHAVSGVDVSLLPAGTLTLSVTVTKQGIGTGAAKTTTATPTFTGILDGLAAPAAAYSTRRLRTAYTGPMLRVRRSSDNSQTDIGASTVGGRLDTAALTSFCGSFSCFVTTWYDQSGNGRDASQASTGRQPRLVNAGTVDTLNGLPAPFFNGSSSGLVSTIALPSATLLWSTHLINVTANGGGNRGRVWGMTSNPSCSATLLGDDYFGATGNSLSAGNSISTRIVSLVVNSSGTSSLWANGTLANSGTGQLYAGGEALAVGNVGDYSRAFAGNIHTIYFGTGSYPTSDRQTVERWLGGLAGISVP